VFTENLHDHSRDYDVQSEASEIERAKSLLTDDLKLSVEQFTEGNVYWKEIIFENHTR